MRENMRKVWTAWTKGKACKAAGSVWTDGQTIYSYYTAILTRRQSDGSLHLNNTQYSRTTSDKQRSIRTLLRASETPYFVGDDMPRGIGAYGVYMATNRHGISGEPCNG